MTFLPVAVKYVQYMKYNFKMLLAGVALPASFISAISFGAINITKTETVGGVARPYIVEFFVDGIRQDVELKGVSSKINVMAIAEELGAMPDSADKYSVFPEIKMAMGGKISIYRAPEYTIIDGKKKSEIKSWAITVRELLDEQRIELMTEDKINLPFNTTLENHAQIKITRVAIAHIDKTQDIDFKKVEKEDKNLDKGKTRVEQKGAKGQKKLTYEVRREDGVEVSRKLIKTEVTKEPVEQITIIGTKPVITGWCKFNDWVLDASIKNGVDPDKICALMRKESNGNPNSVSGGGHLGLFQYTEGFWADASKKAGYAGASWNDARAQIYTTAWAVTHGYAGRWSGTYK